MQLRLQKAALTLLFLGLGVTACGDEPAGPEDLGPPFGTIQGTIVAPGVSTFSDVTARVTWGSETATAAVAADGSFIVSISDPVSGFGSLTIEPGFGEPIHPGWVLLTPGDVDGGSGTVVLAPRTWTIEGGDYAGTVVPIDPELAADSRVLPSYWGFYFPFSQQGFLQTVTDNQQWAGEIRSWPQSAFPIPVALDDIGSHVEFSDADSLTFWSHVDRMEDALGFDAFEPARVEELQLLSGTRRANQAILVQVDEALEPRGTGRVSPPDPQIYSVSADARTWSGTRVQSFDMLSADIRYGVVKLREIDFVEDQQLVIHELMHILGAGHGCSWASVQTYCASLLSDVPTPPDVAHLAVMSELRTLELEHRTRWGVLASVFGHRVVTLGLSPIPEITLIYGPISKPSDWIEDVVIDAVGSSTDFGR